MHSVCTVTPPLSTETACVCVCVCVCVQTYFFLTRACDPFRKGPRCLHRHSSAFFLLFLAFLTRAHTHTHAQIGCATALHTHTAARGSRFVKGNDDDDDDDDDDGGKKFASSEFSRAQAVRGCAYSSSCGVRHSSSS